MASRSQRCGLAARQPERANPNPRRRRPDARADLVLPEPQGLRDLPQRAGRRRPWGEDAGDEPRLRLPFGRRRQRAANLEPSRAVRYAAACGRHRAARAARALDRHLAQLGGSSPLYLDANCSGCHRPGGTVANFDARYDTPLEKQGLINGPVLLDQGIDRPRIISPHDVWRSIAFMRVNTVGDIHMPPLDRRTIDQRGVELLREWIDSLPGPPVLAPPQILPAGGTFAGGVQITLSESEPDADIRYTLDGSVPGRSDSHYDKPFTLSAPTVVRARAFKPGFTKSITAQEVFEAGK